MVLSFLKLAITLKCHVIMKKCKCSHGYEWAIFLWFGFLGRVRLGRIFLRTIPVVSQCSHLVQIALMGYPTFLNPKISGSSQQGYGGIFMTNYVSISSCSAFLQSGLLNAFWPWGSITLSCLAKHHWQGWRQCKAGPAPPWHATIQLVLVSGRRDYSKISDYFPG